MTVAALDERRLPGGRRGYKAVHLFMLARLADHRGARRGELIKDLTPLVSHKLAPAELRARVDEIEQELTISGMVTAVRGRMSLTPDGLDFARRELVKGKALAKDWSRVRDEALPALALGLGGCSARQLKSLARPEGLRAAIISQAFGIKLKTAASPARIRAQLAVVALERAFGNKIKSEFGTGHGLPAKASRLLAAQLLRKPRDFGTDSRLLAAVAAEQIGAARASSDATRLAVLRRLASQLIGATEPSEASVTPDGQGAGGSGLVGGVNGSSAAVRVTGFANGNGRSVTDAVASEHENLRPAAASRPDLEGFAAEVLSAAKPAAVGWPGNRKTYICHVWKAISEAHPEWGLSEIEFKGMLAEAHRTGHVVLANADLKDKKQLAEVQASAISYKNTVWHFVRVED